MKDIGHKLTDDILAKTEKEIKEIYQKAYNEVKKKYAKVILQLENVEDVQKAFRLKKQKEKFEKLLDSIATEINNANKTAISIIKDKNLEIYALNNQYSVYEMQKQAGYLLDIPLYNKNSIKKLIDENSNIFTQIAFDDLKNKNKIIANLKKEMASAIILGEGTQKIASRIKKETNKSMNSSILIARTETTRLENEARKETFKNAEKLGIKLKKQWLATIDQRTRSSHQHLHMEIAEMEEPFSNGLMFPGDPAGEPSEVCNCRCTMVSNIVDIPQTEKEKELDNSLKEMAFEEWRKEL